MQSIAFSDKNAATGLGSATIYIFIYVLQVIFALHLIIFIIITGKKFIKIKLQRKFLEGIFFN